MGYNYYHYDLYFRLINRTIYIVWKAPYFIEAEQEIPGKTAGKVKEKNHSFTF